MSEFESDGRGQPAKPKRPVSAKQLAANRDNGPKSRGPVTPEGKARSSRNRITHGGYASLEPIDRGFFCEDPAELQALVDELRDGFKPWHPLLERQLMIAARRLVGIYRYDRFEALRLIEITTNGCGGPDKQSLLLDLHVLTEAAAILRGPIDGLDAQQWDVLLTVAAMLDTELVESHAQHDPDEGPPSSDLQHRILTSLFREHGPGPVEVAEALDQMIQRRRDELPDPEVERRLALDGLRRGIGYQFFHQSPQTSQRLSRMFQSELRTYRMLEATLREQQASEPDPPEA